MVEKIYQQIDECLKCTLQFYIFAALYKREYRDVAQLVECPSGGRKVASSSLVIPTSKGQQFC